MSKKFVLFFSVILAALALLAMSALSDEAKKDEESKPAHQYVGAKKCKTCHKVQYNSWLESGHATAYDKLSDEEKKKPGVSTANAMILAAKGAGPAIITAPPAAGSMS